VSIATNRGGPAGPVAADSPTARRNAQRAARWGLLALIGATAVAVAATSAWLVVPYLALMGWLLWGPVRGPRARPDPRPRVATTEAPATEAEAPVDPRSDPETPPVVEAPVRKRRRAKARPAAAVVERPATPAAVTWVRVGPGQFVRVESPATAEPEPEPGPSLPSPEGADESAVADPEPIAEPREGPEALEFEGLPALDPGTIVGADPEPEPELEAEPVRVSEAIGCLESRRPSRSSIPWRPPAPGSNRPRSRPDRRLLNGRGPSRTGVARPCGRRSPRRDGRALGRRRPRRSASTRAPPVAG